MMKRKGLLINVTGNGKGKSTSGFGMVIRALGWGHKVALIQFVKNDRETGEKKFFESLQNERLDYFIRGSGFSCTQGPHKESAQEAWAIAEEYLCGKRHADLLVMDEINIAMRQNWLDPEMVAAALKNRPEELTVVLTGRNSPDIIKNCCDTVSDIQEVKHVYKEGVKAQEGIDF